jgi:GNAT superfamily N-acetyltransferase
MRSVIRRGRERERLVATLDPALEVAKADVRAAVPPVEIVGGYRPGLIARITEMHSLYYGRTSGFGQRFESIVAGGLAGLCNRLENPQNAIWAAVQGGEIVGSIAIDGEDMGANIAHLRWFIVDDGVCRHGLGRRLLGAALSFVDERAFAETHLWTFSGLSAARYLYEAHGFACVEECLGSQMGQRSPRAALCTAPPMTKRS